MRFPAGRAGPWDARGDGPLELGRKGSREGWHGPQPIWEKGGKVIGARGKQINRVVGTIIIKKGVIKEWRLCHTQDKQKINGQ